MDYSIDRPTPCRVVLTATIPVDQVAGARERVLRSFLRAAQVPGFRKGKAPRSLVERRYEEQIREDVQERLLHDTWHEVSEKESLRPVGQGVGVDGRWKEDGSYVVTLEAEVFPEVTLPSMEGFTPPVFELEPTDEEIDGAVAQLRERQAAWDPVEGAEAAEGMLVEAEVSGEFPEGGGEPFSGERSLFQLGQHEVPEEIESAVAGHAVGDEVDVERTLGEDAGEDAAGKPARFKVVIKSLRTKRLPDLDDAFAESLGFEKGFAALREAVVERLRVEKLQQRRETWRGALVAHLAGGETLDLPESLVEEETRKDLMDFARALARRGIDPEKAEVDWDGLQKEMRQRVETRLRGELLLDAEADRQGIVVDDATVDAEVERQAERMKVPFAELKGNLAKSGGVDRVRGVLRRERAVDAILQPAEEKGA